MTQLSSTSPMSFFTIISVLTLFDLLELKFIPMCHLFLPIREKLEMLLLLNHKALLLNADLLQEDYTL